VPRLVAGFLRRQKSLLPRENWPALKIVLPRECPIRWRNVFTHGTVAAKPVGGGQSVLSLNGMLDRFPSVLLEPAPQKAAG